MCCEIEEIISNYEINEEEYSLYLSKSSENEIDLPLLSLSYKILLKLKQLCYKLINNEINGNSLLKLAVIVYSNILDGINMNGNTFLPFLSLLSF